MNPLRRVRQPLFAILLWLSVLISGALTPARAETGEHPLYYPELERASRLVLEMRLDEADELIGAWTAEHPERPMGYFFGAVSLSWRIFLLHGEQIDTGDIRDRYEKKITDCRRTAERAFAYEDRKLEGALYLGAAYGLEAMLAMFDGNYLRMAPLARQAWYYVREATRIDPEYHDSYLSVGAYRYFTGALPESIRFIAEGYGFDSDRERGLDDLWLAAERGIYSADEAGIVLMNIYAVKEQPAGYVADMAEEIYGRYPDNPLVALRYGDILYRCGRYEQARGVYAGIEREVDAGNPWYSNPMFGRFAISHRIGACDKQLGNYHAALARFEAILSADEVEPEWVVPATYVEMGEMRLESGEIELAVRDLEAVNRCKKHDKSRRRARALLEQINE